MTEPLRAPAPTPPNRTAAASPSRLAGRFPDDTDADRARPRLVRIAIAIIAVVLVVVVGLYATGAFATSASSYRTATAGRHDVDAVISTVGVLEPVSQATVAFPVSGTVATVSVKFGDKVTAGQQLASLDTQSLTMTLHEKQADLADAELTLAKALNGESVTPSGGSGGIRTASTSSGTTGVVLTATTIAPSTSPQLAQAQQAVLDAQKKVDQTLAAADQAMATAAAACSAAGVGTTTTTVAAAADPVETCKAALAEVQTAQAAVAAAQKQLATASSQLDALLAQQAASAGSGGTGTSSTPNSGAAPSGSTGSSPSSADLVSYQKAVDAAEVEVTAAEQSLAQATLVSPIAGDVVAVNLAAGDDVDAGSSTANIVIEGSGGFEATTNLSVDDITRVSVGQRADVRMDGTGAILDGKVVAISAAPSSSSSSSTTTYRVTVALDRPDVDIRNGATATVSIVTGRATAAVAVPTSAVTTNGSRHSVLVLDGGSTQTVQVQVGVVGATWTEITQGLRAGQSVVLATVSDPLPDSATSSSNTNGGATFFGGGGGGPGGGFPNFGGR